MGTFENADDSPSSYFVRECACIPCEPVVEFHRNRASVSRHGFILVFTSIEPAAVGSTILVRGTSLNYQPYLINTRVSSLDPPVSLTNCSAFPSSFLYGPSYNLSKKSSVEVYFSRWMFSMYCPCGPWIDTEAAWTRSALPSYSWPLRGKYYKLPHSYLTREG